jgi:hypothetical protein
MPRYGINALGRRISNKNSVKLRVLRGEFSLFLIVYIRLFRQISLLRLLNYKVFG